VATAARRLALDVLLEVERGRRPLAELLAEPAIDGLPPRERDLLHELVLGTLRRRGALDRALARALDQPLTRLEAPVVATLRLGAHQLFHLRVPARAAVHESVELLRERGSRAGGLVNAVLRRLAREGPPAPSDATADPRGWLTSEGSLPAWLAERWLSQLGPELAVARARALLAVPETVLRLNPRRSDAGARAADAGLDLETLGIPDALRLRAGHAGPLAREGLLYVQDLGSQIAARLAARPGRLLDACAAPGGKTLLLSDVAGAGSSVVAAEQVRRRLATLAHLVARWGAANVRLVRADAARPPFAAAAFDALLLDAPCSGLGTLGRHPDIRWRAREHELPAHAERQRVFLRALLPLVAPGGSIVYSVCSLEPEEGPAVVEALLQDERFEPAPTPAWCEPYRSGGFVRTLPERDGGDGFFMAALRRRA
jgi:16S rRNA (cytosine967-C5)-methyltransferase